MKIKVIDAQKLIEEIESVEKALIMPQSGFSMLHPAFEAGLVAGKKTAYNCVIHLLKEVQSCQK